MAVQTITFGAFSRLMLAFDYMVDDPRTRNRIADAHVPKDWLARVRQANGQANKLHGTRLADWVPYDLIDPDISDANDDALDTVCTTDEAIAGLLIEHARVHVLMEVLKALRRGDLDGEST
jgi:hypothetical protein